MSMTIGKNFDKGCLNMTLEEINDKFLFKFCNPGNGPVLVCKIEKEKTDPGHMYAYVINFYSCTGEKYGYDFVDNLFVSNDGVNFRENSYYIKDTKPDFEYVKNFIRRLFGVEADSFIEKVLE